MSSARVDACLCRPRAGHPGRLVPEPFDAVPCRPSFKITLSGLALLKMGRQQTHFRETPTWKGLDGSPTHTRRVLARGRGGPHASSARHLTLGPERGGVHPMDLVGTVFIFHLVYVLTEPT